MCTTAQQVQHNNSDCTYLLRKQAAAVEGGNRREEADVRRERVFRGGVKEVK